MTYERWVLNETEPAWFRVDRQVLSYSGTPISGSCLMPAGGQITPLSATLTKKPQHEGSQERVTSHDGLGSNKIPLVQLFTHSRKCGWRRSEAMISWVIPKESSLVASNSSNSSCIKLRSSCARDSCRELGSFPSTISELTLLLPMVMD